MTNKELAELKADIIKLVGQYDGVDISKMIEFDKKLESILSEHQREADYYLIPLFGGEYRRVYSKEEAIKQIKTLNDSLKGLLGELTYEAVYLSAPLKKECPLCQVHKESEEQVKSVIEDLDASLKKENDNGR